MLKKSNIVKKTKEEKRQEFKKNIKRDKFLLLMFLPVAIYYLIFCYLPMTGLVMSFQDFKPGHGLLGIYTGDWVGLKWFRQFFGSTFAWQLIRNTFLLSFYSLLFGFPIPIIFAICITQIRNKHVQRSAQLITYLPYFISTVVVVGMLTNFLSPSTGIVNQIITRLGGTQINFMSTPGWFRSLYVISGSWQSFGFNSIIFVAAIMGISPELYEAMRVDGANKREQIRYLILPMIKSTIILLLIMSLGNLLSVGFEKVYLMYNSAVYETADVISTYVYRQGIENKNFSYATAVGLFNSLVGFTIVSISNWFSRKFNETSIW
ncbi:ABC transporter permease [Lachnotalea glycerini]|nr:ABC transporter permease subunit [Lachnotalea glycerini]